MWLNFFETEVYPDHIYRFSSYLKENITFIYFKGHFFNAA
jgi:hypothetical protein